MEVDLNGLNTLQTFMDTVRARPAVQAAVDAEKATDSKQ